MDFVFDRVASGRTIKCLTIVDDATHEAVAIVAEHTIGGDHLTRILDSICAQARQAAVIRSDNGTEFYGQGDAELGVSQRCAAAADRARQAEPERLRRIVQRTTARRVPERALVHEPASRRAVIETWRREYNEERPKKSLGGLTPAAYAKQLAQKQLHNPDNSKPPRY